jgi:hypothetical protein
VSAVTAVGGEIKTVCDASDQRIRTSAVIPGEGVRNDAWWMITFLRQNNVRAL